MAHEQVPAGSYPAGLMDVGGKRLWLAVLGPLEVWRDGEPVELAPRLRRVLRLLALQPGELVGRETLIDVLWGKRRPDTAAVLVPANVSRLRQALGTEGRDGLIDQDDAGYRLRAGPETLDVLAFNGLVSQARASALAGQWPAACGLYEQALALWRGDPAGDIEMLEDHLAVTRLLRRRVDAVIGYAEVASELGWHERVIPLLEPLARADPRDERVHARLIVALAGVGQQAAAVQIFDDLRRRLDEEVGFLPGEELAAAYQRVLRQDIPASAAATAVPPRPEQPSEPTQASRPDTPPAGSDTPPAGSAGPRHVRPGRRLSGRRLVLLLAVVAVIIAAIYGALALRAPARKPAPTPAPSSGASAVIKFYLSASRLLGYSRPEFCQNFMKEVHCFNVVQGDVATGAGVQVWVHSEVGNADSIFVAEEVGNAGLVTSSWPFTDTALDRKYEGTDWRVIEFEAFPNIHASGKCLSVSETGGRYSPVTLESCYASSDKNSTWALWNSQGGAGHPIIMVGATNKAGSPQEISCLGQGGVIGVCGSGARLVAVKQGVLWTHYEAWSPKKN